MNILESGLLIKDLSIKYNDKSILENINVKFEYGKVYGIIGPNGVGKSTFISAVSRNINYTFGNIKLDGKEIDKYSVEEFSRKVSLMSQDFSLKFPFTIEEVVSMGRYPHCKGRFKKEDHKIIEKALRDTELYHMRKRNVTELSGGERQRVLLGKTLCQDTPLMIIDEGFSNADIYYQVNFLKMISEKAKNENKMIIFILHDLSMAKKFCDEIMILKDKKIYRFGESKEVLDSETLNNVFRVKGKFVEDALVID